METPMMVLVTGATGQIGYMVFKRLNEQPERYVEQRLSLG